MVAWNYDIKQKIKQVRDLLADKNKWTQDAWARDRLGDALTNSLDENAVCWCLDGAINKCAPDWSEARAIRQYLRMFLPKRWGNRSLIRYNDNRTHRSVIRLLDKAINA